MKSNVFDWLVSGFLDKSKIENLSWYMRNSLVCVKLKTLAFLPLSALHIETKPVSPRKDGWTEQRKYVNVN